MQNIQTNDNPLLTISAVAISIYFLRMTKSSLADALDNQIITILILFLVSHISLKNPMQALFATMILAFGIESLKPPAQPVKVESMVSIGDDEEEVPTTIKIRGRNLLDRAIQHFTEVNENKKYMTECTEEGLVIDGQNNDSYYELMADVEDNDDEIPPEVLAQIVSNVVEIKEAIDVAKRETKEAAKEAAQEVAKEVAKETVQIVAQAVGEAKKDIVTEVLINNANNATAVKEAVKEVLQSSSCNSYDPNELVGYDPLFYGASL